MNSREQIVEERRVKVQLLRFHLLLIYGQLIQRIRPKGSR
jgi:hypothetical protein